MTWHNWAMGMVAMALLGACGGQNATTEGLEPGSADAGGTNSDPGSDGSSGDGASGEITPAPCDAAPTGTWKLTYEATGTTGCLAAGSSGAIKLAETAEGLSINYGCAETASTCGVTSFDVSTCSVHAKVESKWVASGEPQCDSRDLTLFFHGDSAEGTMIYEKCWCPAYPPSPVTFRVRAVRQ